MREYRKLYLQRGLSGERWDLNGASGVYATDLAGLGVSLSPSFYDLGGGFFQINDAHKRPQGTPTFTAVFVSSPYATFRRFANWVLTSPELYLIYRPYGEEEFMRQVTLSFLTKGEEDMLGHLNVPTAVSTLTPWFYPSATEMSITTLSGPRKAYLWDEDEQDWGYRYTDELRYAGDAPGDMSVQIVPAGHQPGALLLRYHGELATPTLRLVGLSTGKVYGICSLTAHGGVSLGAGDTLDYSSQTADKHIRKISADGQVTDLLSKADLSLGTPYFQVPTGEAAVFSIESPAIITGQAELTVNYYYETV